MLLAALETVVGFKFVLDNGLFHKTNGEDHAYHILIVSQNLVRDKAQNCQINNEFIRVLLAFAAYVPRGGCRL